MGRTTGGWVAILWAGACAAQSVPELPRPALELIRVERVWQEERALKPYLAPRLAASVILLNTADVPLNAQFSAAATAQERDPHKDKPWASSGAWQLVSNGDHPSLAPRLAMEL